LNELPKPTIARVNGAAYAAGIGLVAACDIAVAAEDAMFSISEVRLGLAPSTISPYVLAAIGARAARRYFLTGEPFSAADACRLGLVHKVVAQTGLDEAVDDVISALLAGGPHSQLRAKRLIAEVAGRPVDDALEALTVRSIAEARASPEGRNGMGPFQTKRRPAGRKEWGGENGGIKPALIPPKAGIQEELGPFSRGRTVFETARHDASRRRHRERFGAGQEPRPRALRQGNAVAHSRLQDAVAALARKVDALDAVGRRERRNVARQAIRLAENALAVAEHGQVERDRDAVEKRRIELAAGGQRRRDDRVADREAAEAFDHEGKTGALWSAERQQRRERPGIRGVASLRVQSPAERNLAPGIARAHHLAHGDSRRGHAGEERRPVLGREGDRQRIARDAGNLGAVVGHHRSRRRHDDAGHPRVRGLQREVADGARVGDVARGAPAD